MMQVKNKISREEIAKIYTQPLPDLLFEAQKIHRENHDQNQVQFCTLSSIKTGACPEDCSYCPQSARYQTGVDVHALLDEEEIISQAKASKANGSTRFCMGASWRDAPNNEQFDQILRIVSTVKDMELEPCVTLGMLHGDQAKRLKEAGLHSYNHNLDTSPEYYPQIISTRTYQERLDTIELVQNADINVCCGGIIGLGESQEDRHSFLEQLANLDPQPMSVPINVLVPVKGTPQYTRLELEDRLDEPIEKFELVRTIATARVIMPQSTIRLSAGRLSMTDELQALCFYAGASSIFTGEKLLTTDNPGENQDKRLLDELGMYVKETVEL